MESLRVVVSGAGASAIACTNFWLRASASSARTCSWSTPRACSGRAAPTRSTSGRRRTCARRRAARSPRRSRAPTCSWAARSRGWSPRRCSRGWRRGPSSSRSRIPIPEISYPDAREARPDAIVATGRSDYPNQVNNVLGFPYIFRGALDVRARSITEEMKLAAARSLAALAREDVPDAVSRAYGGERFSFGPDYIIPKPFDPRVLLWVAPAVAKAAMDGGRGAQADRPRGVPRASPAPAVAPPAGHVDGVREGAEGRQAHRAQRRRARARAAGRGDAEGGGDLRARPAREQGRHRALDRRASPRGRAEGRADRRPDRGAGRRAATPRRTGRSASGTASRCPRRRCAWASAATSAR